MNKDYVYHKLCEILDKKDILIDELMKNHTSFKIGGPADFLVTPRNEDEIKKLIILVNKENIPYFLMGNGSNLLVKDGGIRGVVIKIAENYSDFEIKDNIIKAQSGILLSKLAKNILKNSLSGFEFASGIPGTLGGAIAMNAGAYGGEMKDVVESVRLLDMDGNIVELSNEEMEFGYRKSLITEKNYIVLEAKVALKVGKYEDIKAIYDDLNLKRTTKQPLNMPSAGSTFKRPQGYYAGKLIEDSGLRGLTLKGAQVSTKHCGFVVNTGNASASDILELLDIIKKTVYDKFNVVLEEEVKIIGED
ncbi:UDP-N-acetylmuramate dehydrogenase [Tepidibacter formicigenes]|jgi:UDP-N-acetylmuramate dehydrogenase|uniref:UDP-N-acetylenolpyruvoylglucosamine reductase n=1 Tax=Tepidibacter formicigenes DSM 15518 TaxID=1123349 RepID=A0A1M6JQG6_9FIRM|nr:UDP-N-acetylmuramate dehydrogenase [Tepidibacter formicigenes]SHJ49005.1 UDP-N-acetylmuramate dehydrogenase [Tepidibacter formicigenes DSM 15518]